MDETFMTDFDDCATALDSGAFVHKLEPCARLSYLHIMHVDVEE
jgi:hypothetical protein